MLFEDAAGGIDKVRVLDSGRVLVKVVGSVEGPGIVAPVIWAEGLDRRSLKPVGLEEKEKQRGWVLPPKGGAAILRRKGKLC